LRAIEEQHGILVNRYEDIYSFSHLTLQEFLTAKHIIDNNLDLTKLVANHLGDKRWREVFLLLAGLRKADDLLLTMERQVRTYITTPNLKNLLRWVEEVSDPTHGNIQPIGKRAMAIANAQANAYAYVYAYDCANANAIAIAIANAYVYANANANVNDIANAIDRFIKYAKWSLEFQAYQGLDLPAEIDHLERLKSEIPDPDLPREVHEAFMRKLLNTWLTAFHLTPEIVNLAQEELKSLDNYLYGNRLLVECEHAAVRRSPDVWSQIGARMLRLISPDGSGSVPQWE
jgi:hypothetical protein